MALLAIRKYLLFRMSPIDCLRMLQFPIVAYQKREHQLLLLELGQDDRN
jgi:hypothetical protein